MSPPSPALASGTTFGPVTPRRPQQTPHHNALGDLIHSRRIELGLTWQELAKRGGFSSHTILYALATKPEHKQVPRPVTLERVAKALDVPLDMVKAAAAEAAGYTRQEVKVNLDHADDVRIIVAGCGELPQEDIVRIRRIVQMHVEERRAAKRRSK